MASMQLIQFFEQRRARGVPLILVTVIETSGSTYSKPGHRMLIDDQNLYHGLVSGGCLEGDLLEHAKLVFQDGNARIVTYDLRGENDALWGLGIGCNGLTRLLLQLISPETDYEPMRSIADTWQTQLARMIITVTASSHPQIAVGMSLIRPLDGRPLDDMRPTCALERLTDSVTDRKPVGAGVARFSAVLDGHEVEALQQLLVGLPRVLVLGAGLDAAPVVQGFVNLGWRVSIGDHREAALMRAEFSEVRRLCVTRDAALQEFLSEEQPSAVVIMTHNLQADERYLRLLADCDCAYLGVLGPSHRRARLLKSLEPKIRSRLESRLFGPIGLKIDADSPASIALSVVAQVFAEVKRSTLGASSSMQGLDVARPPVRDPADSNDRASLSN